MIRPIVRLGAPRRAPFAFIVLELIAALAIPTLGYVGVQVLLDSRAGRFMTEPGPADPGYRALVDPSPVTALVLVDEDPAVPAQDRTARDLVVIATPGEGETGGGVILIPGELVIEGQPLDSLRPADAVAALSSALRLRIGTEIVVDDVVWGTSLGAALYLVDNPDPIPVGTEASGGADDTGTDDPAGPSEPAQLAFAVGPVELSAGDLSLYLGADPDNGLGGIDQVRARMFRHRLVWTALLERAPEGSGPLTDLLASVAAGTHRVDVVPLTAAGGAVTLDAGEVEALVLTDVPFPAGSRAGDRLRVRVLGAAGVVDVLAVATEVARDGHEVIEIGNVAADIEPGRRLIVPLGLDDPGVSRLAEALGAATIVSDEVDVDVDGVVTLIDGG